MKRIEEQTTKFNEIKSKLQNNEINQLTDSINKSILDFMNDQKTKNSFISNSLSNVQKNYEIKKNNETKIKEKNKFFTKKYPEQNKNKDIKAKEITQNENVGNFLKNTTNQTQNIQNFAKTNKIEKKGNEIKPESEGASINLLNMENGDIKINEINKIFERERKEELKNSLSINKEKNEQNNEIPQNNNSTKKKYMSDEEDEEIEIEKSKNAFKTNEIMKNYLILTKKESEIKYPQNFSIFDESKMVKDNESSFDDIEEFDNNNNNIQENENNNENKNNISINPLQRIENQNQNQNKENDNNILSGGLKICIPKDDFNYDLKISLDNNKSKENKYLGKKTKITEKPLRKRSLTSKSQHSPNNEQKNKSNIPKNNSKVILDDEDEEEDKSYIDKSQEEKIKNNINSSLFKSPISKIEQKNNNVENYIKHEGTKITLMLGSKTKNNEKNNKLISNENKNNNNNNKKPIKSKSTDSTPKKNNDLISQTKTMTIDHKNNINKNNLINKNKNGSQKSPRKDINNNDNYESQCLTNINNILIKINERLSKEKIDKNFMKKCFEICDIIKNMRNNPSKKKSIYLQFLLIIKNLFLNISENKVSKNYITEINQIFESIEQYFKKIKKDKVLCGSSSFTKRKFAFKYAFAKLELKNMDEIFLKRIIPKTDDGKNNESRSDSNGLIKFTKISKRYLKTSKFLLKELKEFREKMNNSQIKNKYKKYESCLADIQMSPHFMSYNRLFYHSYIILSFYNDYNKLNEEINDKNNNKISKDKINKEKNKSKSNQINHKLNGYGQNEKIIKEKKRDKSEDIKKIQLKK